MLSRVRILSIVVTALCVLAGVSGTAAAATEPARPGPVAGYNKWAWFKDTYWIVPQNGIYSVLHTTSPSQFTVLRGQTVFHLTDYFNGYFLGSVVVKVSRAALPSCQTVLGEVTPAGQVYMTMYDATTGDVTNNPIGTMTRVKGEWTMVNTMTGPATGGTLSHWAYMVQSQKGDRTWDRLPFAKQSIPDFMASCPPGPTFTGR
ncbi:MAG: hypothetical protein Q7V58_01160 [Actinomycetota bacterium]|nr:hypothetical protein [Actinomycetota bacterium]